MIPLFSEPECTRLGKPLALLLLHLFLTLFSCQCACLTFQKAFLGLKSTEDRLPPGLSCWVLVGLILWHNGKAGWSPVVSIHHQLPSLRGIDIVGSPSRQVHVHYFKRLCIGHVKIMSALNMGILFPRLHSPTTQSESLHCICIASSIGTT